MAESRSQRGKEKPDPADIVLEVIRQLIRLSIQLEPDIRIRKLRRRTVLKQFTNLLKKRLLLIR
jgi:hypothetical protein